MLSLLVLLQLQAPTLTATVSRDRIGVNDEIEFVVTATGSPGEAIRISLPPLTGFNVIERAERADVLPGLRSVVLTLRLKATRAGSYGLGPIRAIQGQLEASIDGPDVDVQENAAAGMLALNPRLRDLVARAPPPRRSGQVGLTVLLSQDSVLVGQQIDVLTAAWFPRDLRAQLRRQPVLQPPVIDGVWSFPQTAPPGIAATKRVGGTWYDLFVAHQIVFPLAPGAITVPKAVLRYSVPVAMQFFSQEERFTVTSEPLQVAVQALPMSSAPPGFAGAVGRDIRLERSVNPMRARAAEAVTVDIAVRGEGNVALWPSPTLHWAAGLRNYAEGSSDSSGAVAGRLTGAKRFRYVVVPSEAGVVTIPAVQYPYYDLARRGFAVATLPAMVLPVAEAREASTARAVPPPLLSARGEPLMVRVARGVPTWLAALIAILPPLVVLVLRVQRRVRWRRRERRPVISDPEAELERVLVSLVPWDEAMSPERLASALRAAGLDDASARDVASLRERMLRHRFGPHGAAGPAPDRAAVETALRRLSGVLGGRATRVALSLLLLVVRSAAGQTGKPAEALYADGSLVAAEHAFAGRTAKAPGDPAHWYNLGATRYRLGRDGPATAAWLTALRLDPRNVTVRRALDLTPSPDDASARRRYVPPVRATELFVLALVAWWAGWALFLQRRRRRYAAWLLALASVLGIGGFVLRSWNARFLVLASRDTPLRVAPHGKAASLAPLAAGTVVVGQRATPGWVLVQGPAGALGWVERDALAAVGE
ncbi:MAG: BatD family protein [Gemmatimonadales bacterium]